MIEFASRVAGICPAEIGSGSNDTQYDDRIVEVIKRVEQNSIALFDSSFPEPCNKLAYQNLSLYRGNGN